MQVKILQEPRTAIALNKNFFAANTPSVKQDIEKKACKHRDENGWCSKSQRMCALFRNTLN